MRPVSFLKKIKCNCKIQNCDQYCASVCNKTGKRETKRQKQKDRHTYRNRKSQRAKKRNIFQEKGREKQIKALVNLYPCAVGNPRQRQ